jgi:hypothetical protein
MVYRQALARLMFLFDVFHRLITNYKYGKPHLKL